MYSGREKIRQLASEVESPNSDTTDSKVGRRETLTSRAKRIIGRALETPGKSTNSKTLMKVINVYCEANDVE
jgi:hypothetical protein